MLTTEQTFGFIFLLLFATLAAELAAKKGLRWKAWFFWTLLFGPLAIVVLYLLRGKEQKTTKNLKFFSIEVEGLWFYLDEKSKQMGPVSSRKIQEMLQKDLLSKDSYIWSEGMKHWERLQNTPFKNVLQDEM
ncbi:MAG: DUF4339 domain-containing protein [Chlamydiota bacterium]